MKAVILAAGYATRMYPLTLNFPKPLLPVGGKSIIDWLTDDIQASGIRDIFVVTNHKFYSAFLEWSEKREGITVLDDSTESNETRLGALRDIEYVIRSAHIDDDIFVIAGDNVLDFSFRSFLSYALDKKTSCIMRHYQGDTEKLRRTGVCLVDGNDRVISMEEKPQNPPSCWAVPPFYYYTRSDLPLLFCAIAEGISTDAPGSFVSYLCRKSTVHAFLMPGRRYDIGTIEGWETLRESYRGITETC